MYRPVELHALAADAEHLRIWVGVFDHTPPLRLEWRLNGVTLEPTQVRQRRPLSPVRPGPPAVITQTGVFDLPVTPLIDPMLKSTPHVVEVEAVWPDGRRMRSLPFTTRPLPGEVPAGIGRSFNVLLVSCFYEPRDSFGKAGSLAAALASHDSTRPDLVLTVGDQVYLDNPPLGTVKHYTHDALAKSFEVKYRRNWQGMGYAQILRAGPVAAIPDDHEFWNNYPQKNFPLPTLFSKSSRNWEKAARDMYDAFQLGPTDTYSYKVVVPPLSFFLLDNRTFREKSTHGDPSPSARAADLDAYDVWVDEVIGSPDLIPVLVTGPSLFQGPKRGVGKVMDLNLANCADYPAIMRGLLRLSSHGRPPLALTGDVHYGRVISALHATGNPYRPWSKLYEVISSPASLVGGSQPDAARPDQRFSIEGTSVTLGCEMLWPTKDSIEMTDHLALLRFGRTPTGVRLETTYWMLNEPGLSAGPYRAPEIPLNRFPATA